MYCNNTHGYPINIPQNSQENIWTHNNTRLLSYTRTITQECPINIHQSSGLFKLDIWAHNNTGDTVSYLRISTTITEQNIMMHNNNFMLSYTCMYCNNNHKSPQKSHKNPKNITHKHTHMLSYLDLKGDYLVQHMF